MNLSCNNILLIIFGIVVLALIIYFLFNRKDPLPTTRTISPFDNLKNQQVNIPVNYNRDEISDSVVDTLLSKYDDNTANIYGTDPLNDEYSPFDDYVQKKSINMKNMDEPFSDDNIDPRDFCYKKNKFTKRTPDDIKDLFNVNKMLPQEIEDDWFDVEPLQCTKKIKGTHLIHPKVHMGINTVGSSLKNGSHDIRGDIPNPKINVSPFLNSTIEPDTNIKGFCN
ncbi:hypothetical protein H012_gp605 [Acanthamoeba polyphaga moumouvirus]|uniref:Minor capsid protein P11 C-terminal conserved region domain-containing protein n=1 Tax=Acanthamoeba polyphaga moumouvirus TaxID=1269028 RepID=L7RCT9_9VIRU|nr:hypothetical protein H012_gp605 [Acanthamoeba polyphaga moumouvirus]AGC01858.1 hypothetical protein Moumou_00318 [Acanthamoeba polyphaga moumouvirus]AQN68217.1 hypothetical protein [Saudi moumouvirus]